MADRQKSEEIALNRYRVIAPIITAMYDCILLVQDGEWIYKQNLLQHIRNFDTLYSQWELQRNAYLILTLRGGAGDVSCQKRRTGVTGGCAGDGFIRINRSTNNPGASARVGGGYRTGENIKSHLTRLHGRGCRFWWGTTLGRGARHGAARWQTGQGKKSQGEYVWIRFDRIRAYPPKGCNEEMADALLGTKRGEI